MQPLHLRWIFRTRTCPGSTSNITCTFLSSRKLSLKLSKHNFWAMNLPTNQKAASTANTTVVKVSWLSIFL